MESKTKHPLKLRRRRDENVPKSTTPPPLLSPSLPLLVLYWSEETEEKKPFPISDDGGGQRVHSEGDESVAKPEARDGDEAAAKRRRRTDKQGKENEFSTFPFIFFVSFDTKKMDFKPLKRK
ncbi:hypothetical protein LINPERPRIM_LOCUS24001 [Linum perenne]